MRNVALDLGRRISFCEVAGGEVVGRRTVASLEQLGVVLGPGNASAVVAIEACREAWHVHDVLTEWGHEVWLVDTTRAKQLGIGQHQRKTDRIDAEVMARAVEENRIPRAHVLSAPRRKLREALGLRSVLVRSRASFITTARGVLRSHGIRLPDCAAEKFVAVLGASQLGVAQRKLVEPLSMSIKNLDALIRDADAQLEALALDEPVIKKLMTVPGVATIVASAFVSVVDNPKRFKHAHQVEAYAGLVPSENTSGRRKLGSITKEGNSYLRAVLLQSAWSIIRKSGANPLKTWALSVAKRRGRNIAAVALARRLVGVLWALWRDGTVFEPERVGRASATGLSAQATTVSAVADAMNQQAQDPRLVELSLKKATQKVPAAIRRKAATIRTAQ